MILDLVKKRKTNDAYTRAGANYIRLFYDAPIDRLLDVPTKHAYPLYMRVFGFPIFFPSRKYIHAIYI